MVIAKTNKPLLFLITLLIVGSLVNINILGPTTLSAYFFYTILGALLAVIAGVGLLKSKQPIQINNPLPILLLGLLAVYYIINGLINKQGGINLRHYVILVDAVLLVSYCMLISKESISLLAISKIITVIAAIESIICILQQLGIVASQDNLFKVTGSNVNPNVTAMFLAMAVPALLLVLFKGSKIYLLFAIASFSLSLVALALIQCRTAFIGAAVSTALILNHQYQLLHKLKSKFNKAVLIITTIISITLIILAFTLLYHSKQASSDGRLFIWKISLQAIANKPIFGSGYGQFEHDYNLAQANYFATKATTQKEIFNAGYTHMSYNEFLENLFEGGVIGLVLFVALLVTLLFTPLGDGGVFFAYAGIASFTIMCFFNFTVQALPVRALFVLYASVCCVTPRHFDALRNMKQSSLNLQSTTFQKLSNLVRINLMPYAFFLTALSLFLFFKLLTLSKAYNQCHTIVETHNELDNSEVLRQMATYKTDLSQSTYYWRNYGELLMQTKHYDAAIDKFNMALDFSSDPNLYMQLGNIYSKRGRFTDAMQTYTLASNIEPHRFAPKYGLMKLYSFAKDSASAKNMAEEIVTMNPKVESEKVTFYKTEARKLIDN